MCREDATRDDGFCHDDVISHARVAFKCTTSWYHFRRRVESPRCALWIDLVVCVEDSWKQKPFARRTRWREFGLLIWRGGLDFKGNHEKVLGGSGKSPKKPLRFTHITAVRARMTYGSIKTNEDPRSSLDFYDLSSYEALRPPRR